jgi:hypothetical protein
MLGRHRIEPDHADEHAKRASKNPLDQGAARESAHQQDAPDSQHEVIAGRKLERKL